MPLEIYELQELHQNLISDMTEDKWLEVLCNLNRRGRLNELLNLIGEECLLKSDNTWNINKKGIIVVLGGSRVKKDKLCLAAKKIGISEDRFEFHLDYEDGKTFDATKLQYSPKYNLVLVGAIGHSGVSKGDDSSVIAHMKNTDGFPEIIELMANNALKITKENFQKALEDALDRGVIERDLDVKI